MAKAINQRQSARVAARRQAVIEEALDHAERIVAERGAGAVTIAELARGLGMQPPSVYKYFTSLHGVYDALFLRGYARLSAFVDEAARDVDPGLARLQESNRAIVRWSVLNRGLAPLLFWRPIPGFQPDPRSYRLAEDLVERCRVDLRTAVRRGQLAPDADSDQALRLFTTISAGLCSQQMANEPDATYETGRFTSLTDQALEMFVHHYAPSP